VKSLLDNLGFSLGLADNQEKIKFSMREEPIKRSARADDAVGAVG
jgi:hypothetical protein